MRRAGWAAIGFVLTLGAAGASHAALPAGSVVSDVQPGRHEVELCVAIGDKEPGCGPAEAFADERGGIHLRISDIVYHLTVVADGGGAVDVIVMHGTMQIDEFLAPGEWAGTRLKFHDRKKNARYDVRFPDGSVRTRRQDSR